MCTFNFTSALFTNQGLSEDVGPERLLKDIPVALLLVAGFLFARPRRSMSRANLWLALWASLVVVLGAFRAASDSLPLVFPSVRYLLVYPVAGIAVWRLRLTAEESQRILRLLVGLGVLVALIACAESLRFIGGHTYYAGYTEGSHVLDTRAIASLGNPDNLALFLRVAGGFPSALR